MIPTTYYPRCDYCGDTQEWGGEPCPACRTRMPHDPDAPTGAAAAYAVLAFVFLAGVAVGALL